MMTFVPIEAELARRGIRLKRIGRELVGPCPKCGGRDRFAVNTAKDIWNCRGCQKGGDTIDLVQYLDGVGFAQAVKILTGEKPQAAPVAKTTPKTKINGGDDYERRQREKARWLWSRRQPIAGSIAERYLREARGITAAPATLAFLPPAKQHHPAMIAAYGIPDEPEPGALAIAVEQITAVHLTLLKPDGSGKAEVEKPKITIASPAGMPIVLAPLSDSMGLVITEGIEDALSVHQATGLGAWAAGSAGFMSKLAAAITDASPECVTIWGHADVAGQDGVHNLATLLDARGIETFIEGTA